MFYDRFPKSYSAILVLETLKIEKQQLQKELKTSKL